MEGRNVANKKLTEEEMERLKVNPYVLDVSPSIVHFSAEFKEKFWNEMQAGGNPQKIVAALGVDPDVLGAGRINGLKSMIRNEVRAGKGFRDLKSYGTQIHPEAKVKYLEQQLAYKDQEIEFLKKIVSLGRGKGES
jgi:hypothetical protein